MFPRMKISSFPGDNTPIARLPKLLAAFGATAMLVATASAQTVGTGTITSPAVGPAPAYQYGFGSGINSAVLIKNWDFGTSGESTIHNISELTTHFQYHDQFGRDANGGGYGSRIVVPDASLKINSTQPVENVNISGTIREFTGTSIKTYLKPLNGATTASSGTAANQQTVGNGSFQAKWTGPRGGSLLGLDMIWETRVRYVTPRHFWFAIWTCGNAWQDPKTTPPGGAEMDLVESFGYNNGGTYTNYDGRFWHSSAVGGNYETNYHAGWSGGMSAYGITNFDATQWHTWTWVYRADNTFISYLDGIPVQRGKIHWTDGGEPTDTPINMSFIFDGGWGHQKVGGMAGFSIPASELAGKYYEWDYSRVYYRVPTPADRKNLAISGTIASVSSQESNNAAVKVIDDIYNTDNNRWSPVAAGFPQRVELDLGANKRIDETNIVARAKDAYRYTIEAKPEGGTYSTIVDKSLSTDNTPIHFASFAPVVARYVQLRLVGSSNASWVGLREFRVVGSNVTTPPSGNIALYAPAVASSTFAADVPASKAVDGNTGTRWASNYAEGQWIYVDLGEVRSIERVKLQWEAAYASAYRVQVSNDAQTWSDIHVTTTGNGATDDLTGLSGSGRYVRVLAVTNATTFGISLFDFEVYPLTANLALNKPAVASSTITSSYPASKAVDGNTSTRWASHYSTGQWIYVDLGSVQQISRVKLKWEVAYASAYKVQVSNDAVTWTDIYYTTTGNGAVDDLRDISGSGRYVRVLAVTNGTTWGISLWDFEVYP